MSRQGFAPATAGLTREHETCGQAATRPPLSILRNLPQVPEFVVAWEYPLMRVATELNPDALRRPQSKNKVCTDREFIEQLLSEAPAARAAIVAKAENLGISSATADRYLKRLSEAGLIGSGGGLY